MISNFLRGSATVDVAKDRHQLRELRLARIKDVVDAFLYGIALVMAGQAPAFGGSADAALETRLRQSLSPFLKSRAMLRPDFGPFAELRIDGDLLNVDEPVAVTVDFEDRSLWLDPRGRFLESPRRQVRLRMSVLLEPCIVHDCIVTLPG